MNNDEMILAHEFCTYHKVEFSLIQSFKEHGLINMIIIEEKIYVPTDELCELEKMVRFYEMGINLEGIETIQHLLHQMNDMNRKINELRNRLQVFE